jgi:hypothetical protein
LNEPGFIPLFSQLRKAFSADLSIPNMNRADFTEKPAAIVAWIHRTVSRMKVANGFVLLREADFGASSGAPVKFREDVSLDLRMAGWTSLRLPRDKEIYRERLAAARAGEMGGHLA